MKKLLTGTLALSMLMAFDINSPENQEKLEYYQNNMTKEEFNLLVNDLHNQSNDNDEESRDSELNIMCGGGTYQQEVSWRLEHASSPYSLEGWCPYSQDWINYFPWGQELEGEYRLEMFDSWGDGWNGNFLTIDTDFGQYEFTLDDGSWGEEFFYIGFTGSGCTDSVACNYNSDATEDDGSCEYESCLDCAGILNGSAVEDNCGICDEDPTNDCVQDCSGIWGGDAVVDECDVCEGPGAIYECGCSDVADGACDCDGNVLDACGTCGGNADGTDCNEDGIDDVCEDEYQLGFDLGFFEGESTGDVNHSGDVNVTDIVQIIDMILNSD